MYAKGGFIAVAKAEAKAEAIVIATAKAEAKLEADLQRHRRLSVMRSWHKGLALDVILFVSDLPSDIVSKLVDSFEKVKSYYRSTEEIDMKVLKKLSNLSDVELKALIELLKNP